MASFLDGPSGHHPVANELSAAWHAIFSVFRSDPFYRRSSEDGMGLDL